MNRNSPSTRSMGKFMEKTRMMEAVRLVQKVKEKNLLPPNSIIHHRLF